MKFLKYLELPKSLDEWLQGYGMQQYTQLFLDNGFDNLRVLKELTMDDLNSIGVPLLGHRKTLLLAAQELKESFNAVEKNTPGIGCGVTPNKFTANNSSGRQEVTNHVRPRQSKLYHDDVNNITNWDEGIGQENVIQEMSNVTSGDNYCSNEKQYSRQNSQDNVHQARYEDLILKNSVILSLL